MFSIKNYLLKIKLWMESFANKPFAMTSLLVLAFIESSFFPIPPDILLIAIAVLYPKKSFKAAMWCTIGSVFGGIFGYVIGWGLMETAGKTIIELYQAQSAWNEFLNYYNKYGEVFLAAAAFSPIPYKVATISAGATQMNITAFIIISSFGRAGRFFLIAAIIYFLGPSVRVYIDKYFDKLSIAFVVLLIAGFLIIKYLI